MQDAGLHDLLYLSIYFSLSDLCTAGNKRRLPASKWVTVYFVHIFDQKLHSMLATDMVSLNSVYILHQNPDNNQLTASHIFHITDANVHFTY